MGANRNAKNTHLWGSGGSKWGGDPQKRVENTPKTPQKGPKKGGIKGVFEFYLLGKGGIRDPLFLITNKSWRNAIIKWYGPPVSGGRGGCGKTSLISTFFGLFRNFAHTFFRGGGKKGG
jgi:hypothetical protein